MMRTIPYCSGVLALLLACGSDRSTQGDSRGGVDGSTGAVDSAAGEDEGEADSGMRLDVGVHDLPPIDTGGMLSCTVTPGGGDAMIPCDVSAPPDSFDPEVQWEFGEGLHSASTPLVANLTDDNGDGNIDLCDIPDVVVVVYDESNLYGRVVVLDGGTGARHFELDVYTSVSDTPAIGDIDGDGLPEIVLNGVGDRPHPRDPEDDGLVAFEHDGTLKWNRVREIGWGQIALADVDNDGDVEIMTDIELADHEGTQLWTADTAVVSSGRFPNAADLDGDGDLEIVWGHAAYHHDGTVYYDRSDLVVRERMPGRPLLPASSSPAVANLDDDPEPEILVMGYLGFIILEHDGTQKAEWQTPTTDTNEGDNWIRPPTIHDFDGDGKAEFAVNSGLKYSAIKPEGTLLWSAQVNEASGLASGTAFDFLGDGSAEAVFADETHLIVFDEIGDRIMETPRTSYTAYEYPTVADVDNDGSAEILVVSNTQNRDPFPALHAVRDREDRWIPARRIWNQHTYHVTNVREDGTIPQFEQPAWEGLNSFRTQAQLSTGGVACRPLPQG